MNLDIQNIVILVEMYEKRSVKSVAAAQRKTSSAISKTLAKLKNQLDDPLFIQNGNAYEPTYFLQSNIHYFRSVLQCIRGIKSPQFDPSTDHEPLTLYAQSFFWNRYGAKLYQTIRQQAPYCMVSMNNWNNENQHKLLNGQGEVAFHALSENLPQSLIQQKLPTVQVCAFVREDHPAQTFEQLSLYPLVLLSSPGWNDYRFHVIERLKQYGYDLQPSIVIESYSTCNEIVLTSDHFQLTASTDVPKGGRIIPLPQNVSFTLEHVMSYRRSQRDNPKIQWLTQICCSVIESIDSHSPILNSQ